MVFKAAMSFYTTNKVLKQSVVTLKVKIRRCCGCVVRWTVSWYVILLQKVQIEHSLVEVWGVMRR